MLMTSRCQPAQAQEMSSFNDSKEHTFNCLRMARQSSRGHAVFSPLERRILSALELAKETFLQMLSSKQ